MKHNVENIFLSIVWHQTGPYSNMQVTTILRKGVQQSVCSYRELS